MPKSPNTKIKSNDNPNSRKEVKFQAEPILIDLHPDEVSLTLEIKEIRYGRRLLISPEITTLIQNTKVVSPVPFEAPFKYTFRRTEDDMVFKFAVTSAGDLLGFIYMEIPLKFKTIKKFRLDDWFPVKQIQTQDSEKMKVENFVARVIINYQSIRKLDPSGLNTTPKLLKTQLVEQTDKNLRLKINDIHNEIGVFEDLGFQHLGDFHRKLMNKKIKSQSALIQTGKKEQLSPSPNRLLTTQKEAVYRAKVNIGQSQKLQSGNLPIKELFNRHVNASTDNLIGRNTPSCLTCENFLKELTFTRKELVEANQRISALEDQQMSVDNVKLRRQLENFQDELTKDKKELTLRLRNNASILEQDRAKLSKTSIEENSKANNLKKEASAIIAEYKLKTGELIAWETRLKEQDQEVRNTIRQVNKTENSMNEKTKGLIKDQNDLFREKEEWNEMKSRMIQERKKIHEHASKFQFLKTDLSLKKEQLETLDEYFGDEKNKFRKEIDAKIELIESLKTELLKKQEIFELEQRHFEDQQKSLEDKNLKLMNEMKIIKAETAKLNVLRLKTTQETDVLIQTKISVSQNQNLVAEEIEKDFTFVEQQLKLIEDQKKEIAKMQETLETYEKSLESQNKVHIDLETRINIFSKHVAQKLNSLDFSPDELKTVLQNFTFDFKNAETKFIENQKITRDFEKNRVSIRKNLSVIAEKSSKSINLIERKSIHEKRITKRIQEQFQASNYQDANSVKMDQFGDYANNQLSHSSKIQEEKENMISDLKILVKLQQDQISDLQNFYQKNRNSVSEKNSTVKIILDPDMPPEQLKINEIKTEIESLFLQKIQLIKDNNHGKINSPKLVERIKSMESAVTVMRNVLKILGQMADSQGENFVFNGDVFDH